MKILLLEIQLFFAFFLLSATHSISQAQTSRGPLSNPVLTSGNEFNMYQKAGGGGLDAFNTRPSGDIKGNQFFLPDWENGEVVTVRKEVYSKGMEFIYDKVRQQLFVRKKDSLSILLTNKDEIQSFSLKDGNKGQYNFVNSKLFTDNRPEVFYQVLVYDSSKFSLFKYTKTSFVRGDPTDMMKQKVGAVYDEFVDKYTYYLTLGKGDLNEIQLKSKSFKKVFEVLHINYEQYLKNHPGPQDEKYLIDMVRTLNH
jgi:hypothetical protein